MPIRVELEALSSDDFKRILREPDFSLIKQYVALLKTENVDLEFSDDGIDAIANIASEVNTTVENIGSIPSYASLKDIPDKIDIVNVFRKKEFVKSITNDAIKIDAKVLWLQEGIVDNDAAVLASSHGMAVVMDLCMLKEHKKI